MWIIHLRIREKDALIQKRTEHTHTYTQIMSTYVCKNHLNKIQYEKIATNDEEKEIHIQKEIVSETIKETKA